MVVTSSLASGRVWRHQKLKIGLPYDTIILLLGIPRTQTFNASIYKYAHIYVYIHIQTYVYCSAIYKLLKI